MGLEDSIKKQFKFVAGRFKSAIQKYISFNHIKKEASKFEASYYF